MQTGTDIWVDTLPFLHKFAQNNLGRNSTWIRAEYGKSHKHIYTQM